MKIKRFHARTMRDALQQVREEQGPDSVILSKQRIGDGIEVIAAVDYDEALLHQSNQVLGASAMASGGRSRQGNPATQPSAPATEEKPATNQASIGSFFARVYSDTADTAAEDETLQEDEVTLNAIADETSTDEASSGAASASAESNETVAATGADFRSIFDATSTIATLPEPGAAALPDQEMSSTLAAIAAQLNSLQQTVADQYSELHWDDLQRRTPHLAEVIDRLESLGLAQWLVQRIVSALPDEAGGKAPDPARTKKAWRTAIGLLAKQIPVASQDVCEEGGVFAVVGPTGAGKTTCIAKLAARFALEHDPQSLGLITTDSFRIGAQEHLLRFGKILGVPVQVAGTPEILSATLDQLADRKLILIDTAGFSMNDSGMLENLASLTRHSPTVQTLLALPANLQTAALRQAINTFDPLGLDGAIATKVDEATSLGGLLSAVIETNLSVCYVADGQRVPEDLKPASRFRAGFVSQAVSLARKFSVKDQQLELRTKHPASDRPPGELHAITTEDRLASYG